MDERETEACAKAAYEAYGVAVGGKTWDGKDIPDWDDLQDRQRDGWRAAAQAAVARADEGIDGGEIG